MDNFGTAYGLALSSGINAYLPLLSFSIAVRWFHLFRVSQSFAFITQDGFIIALVVLSILDIIADKIPVFDSIWDSIHTVLRPISGAIVAGASSTFIPTTVLPAVMILGGTVAAMGHTTKAVTRLTASVSTMGCANTSISIVEDILMIAAILLAIFVPVIMLVIALIFSALFVVFAPLLFSTLNYRLRMTLSILSWFIHSYFWRRAQPSSSDFMMALSDNERTYLYQILPPDVIVYGGVRLLWLRRLGGRGLWGSRRVALSTWFVVTNGAIILLPHSRLQLRQMIPFPQIQALVLDQGLLMGSLRLLTQNGQACNFTVLRDSLDTTSDLVEALHVRYRLPSGATPGTGSTRTRPSGPQRI